MSGTSPNSPALSASATEALAATIASAVERQLTQYVSAMGKQVDAARQAAEAAKTELREEFNSRLEAALAQVDANQRTSEAARSELHQVTQATRTELQQSFDGRLAEFDRQQQAALVDTENRLLASANSTALDMEELANLRDQMDSQSAAAHARIDELQRATRRFDEQASALVQHVNDTTIALASRMDEGNQALASAVEERLAFVRTTLEAVGPEVHRQLTENNVQLTQRIDFTEHKVTDRMLAMEDRINESNGQKLAHLEASLGRIGAGFDDAMAALSQRMLELENHVASTDDRMNVLQEQVSRVDEKAINAVKEQLSAAVGEAMLVRIELDRLEKQVDDRIGKATLRMAEIEAKLADEMDVDAAVQLERLEELERAIVALDPAQFVRKADVQASRNATGPNPSLSSDSSTTSTEPSLSSF